MADGKIEGKTEGRIEVISEELNRLYLLKSQNVLNDSLFEILSGPLKKELEYLEAMRSMKKSSDFQ